MYVYTRQTGRVKEFFHLVSVKEKVEYSMVDRVPFLILGPVLYFLVEDFLDSRWFSSLFYLPWLTTFFPLS